MEWGEAVLWRDTHFPRFNFFLSLHNFIGVRFASIPYSFQYEFIRISLSALHTDITLLSLS